MQCPDCGNFLKKVVRDICVPFLGAGPIEVKQAEFWECEKCGSVLYPAHTVSRIDVEREKMIINFYGTREVTVLQTR